MAFSNNLRYLRKKYGLSQEKLAEKLGYKSFTTIQKWETGVSEPSFSIVKSLADIFNVSMEALINDEIDDDYEPETIAAHHDDEDWTDEELAEIEEFKKYVKKQAQITLGAMELTYEKLLAEYEEQLDVTERSMVNEGLYADGCVWIKKDLPTNRKACILAEEIGHYETSSGNILDQSDIRNAKQELLARKWAFHKLVPCERIVEAAEHGYVTTWDMAEYLDIDEEFLKDCLMHYGILDISL